MRSGALHNPIIIQTRTQTGTTDLNEPIWTWSTYRECFAEIRTRRGVENYDTGTAQRYSETVYRFIVRFEDARGVGAEMRILFDDKIFQVTNTMPDYDRRNDVLIEAILQDGRIGVV